MCRGSETGAASGRSARALTRFRKLKRGESPGGDRDEQDNLVRFRAHRAEIEGLKLAKLRGELIDRATAIAMMAGWVRTFARGILAVEGRLAHALDDGQRELLRTELRALLDALSRAGEKVGQSTDPRT